MSLTTSSRWTKCTTVLERASKIVFLEPEQGSPYKIAWSQYSASFQQDKSLSPPADYLNQPKFRNPKDHMECVKAIEEIIKSNGEEGIFPPTRMAQAQAEGLPEPEIPSYVIMFHHMISAAQVFLHDINSLNSENVEALKAARKSVKLFQVLPPIVSDSRISQSNM